MTSRLLNNHGILPEIVRCLFIYLFFKKKLETGLIISLRKISPDQQKE